MEKLLSGILYVFVFTLSGICFYLVEKSSAWRIKTTLNVFLRNMVLLIAIIIPCILAGLRADTVGVDVKVYITPIMERAYYCDSFVEVCETLDFAPEYIFMFLVYFCSRFTSDGGLLMFFLQVCTITPIVLAVIVMRKKVSLSFAMMTYFFCFYNNSLNMMRQSICLAIILLGGVYLIGNNAKFNKKVIICYALALMSHNSALIGIIISVAIIKVSYSRLLSKFKMAIYIAIVVLPSILIIGFEFLNSWGILSDQYVTYAEIFLYHTIDKDWFVNPFSIRILTDVFFKIILVGVSFLFYKNTYKKANEKIEQNVIYSTLLTIVTSGLLIYLVILYGMKTVYGIRISLFLDIFLVIFIPYSIGEKYKKDKKIIMLSIMLLYWTLWVMIGGWSGSSIYSLRI